MTDDERAFIAELASAIEFIAELASAIEPSNGGHSAPFLIDDVVAVEAGWKLDHGDFAETDIEGVVVLKDGRRFKVVGWCDTTGWDCRSGLDCEEVL